MFIFRYLGGDFIEVSLNEVVRYCGHEVIRYKDGRKFVNLSVIDEENKPIQIFCPGSVELALGNVSFGQELGLVFYVQKWNNTLQLRCKDVIV